MKRQFLVAALILTAFPAGAQAQKPNTNGWPELEWCRDGNGSQGYLHWANFWFPCWAW